MSELTDALEVPATQLGPAVRTARADRRHLGRHLGRAPIGYLALLAAIASAFLFSPQPRAETYCGERVHLGARASFLFHCDSEEFMRASIHPSRLLEAHSTRQSRPLLPLLAAPVAHVIDVPVERLHLAPTSVGAALTKHATSLSAGQALSSYAAYVLLNALLVLAGLLLFHRVVGGRWLVAGATASLLLSSDFIKTFFWTPHTQMFNLVVPLGGILVCRSLLAGPVRSIRSIAGLGLGTGVLALAYGSFLVWIPVALVALAFGPRLGRRGFAGRAGALIAGFAAPTLAWIGVCVATAGSYYNEEISRFREFVWVADAVREGYLGSAAIRNLGAYARVLGPVVLWPFVLLAVALAAAALFRIRASMLGRDRRLSVAAAGVTLVCVLLFGAFQGYYVPRLAWAAVPPLVVAFGVVVQAIAERLQGRRCALVVAATVVLAVGAFVHEWSKARYWYARAEGGPPVSLVRTGYI